MKITVHPRPASDGVREIVLSPETTAECEQLEWLLSRGWVRAFERFANRGHLLSVTLPLGAPVESAPPANDVEGTFVGFGLDIPMARQPDGSLLSEEIDAALLWGHKCS